MLHCEVGIDSKSNDLRIQYIMICKQIIQIKRPVNKRQQVGSLHGKLVFVSASGQCTESKQA